MFDVFGKVDRVKSVLRGHEAVVKAVLLAAVMMAAAGSVACFTCDQVRQGPLVVLPHCDIRRLKINCLKKPNTSYFMSHLMLVFQHQHHFAPNSTNVDICLRYGPHSWIFKDINVTMQFAHNFTVGVVTMDKKCLKRYRPSQCHGIVRLRADIAELPIVKFHPDDHRFWNFTAPLFGPSFGWFRQFSMFGSFGAMNPTRIVRALYGTGVEDVILHENTKLGRTLPHLQNMSNLVYLVLQFYITLNPEETFNGTPNLRYLRLEEGNMFAIPPSVRQMKNLDLLSLSGNRIHSLSNELSHYTNLSRLILDYNPLGPELDPFPNSMKLWLLSVRVCGIKSLPAHAFRGLEELRILDISGNLFMYLDPLAFSSLPSLIRLWMQDCSLTEWPMLRGLKLTFLDLSRNSLRSMVNFGEIETTVHTLIVIKNKIQGWNDPSIFSCQKEETISNGILASETFDNASKGRTVRKVCWNGTWLVTLDMRNNLIRSIPLAMRKSLSHINKIDLSGNNIDCTDCETPALQQWLKETPVHFEKPLLCDAPDWDKGTPVTKLVYNNLPCLQPVRRLLMNIVVPIMVVVSIVTAAGATCYLYRIEVAYLRHLIHIRHNTRNSNTGVLKKYDAFVCYSGRNRKWVLRRLALLLERPPESYRVCLFDRDFRLGSHIVSNIVDAIDQSNKVIIVLTEHFISSKWCQWELEMANHKLFDEDREFLVLLELEPLERARLPRLLRFLLATRPVVRWPRPETAAAVLAAAAELRRALGPSLRQRGAPAPAPARPRSPPQERAGGSAADETTPLLWTAGAASR